MTTIFASSPSIVFCLAGVKDFCKNWLIELWVVGSGSCGVLDDAVDSAAAATAAVDTLAPSLIAGSLLVFLLPIAPWDEQFSCACAGCLWSLLDMKF